MINGSSDALVGENIFGKHTSTIGSLHTTIMTVVTGLERERLEVLLPYDMEEDMMSKKDKTALHILDTLIKEFRNLMIGIELYGKLK